jgi:hypothetical protein
MGLAKLIWFVVTNLPALIKFIKDVLDLFEGDTKLAKECVGDICEALPKEMARPETKEQVIKSAKRRLLRRRAQRGKNKREL